MGVTVSATQVRSNGAQLAELGRLLDAGTVRVAVDGTFPLAEARAAHERAARGRLRGKIVLTVEARTSNGGSELAEPDPQPVAAAMDTVIDQIASRLRA